MLISLVKLDKVQWAKDWAQQQFVEYFRGEHWVFADLWQRRNLDLVVSSNFQNVLESCFDHILLSVDFLDFAGLRQHNRETFFIESVIVLKVFAHIFGEQKE